MHPRPPLTLLVARTTHDSQTGIFLGALGAITRFIPNCLIGEFFRSSSFQFIADAIVVDGTSLVYVAGGINPRPDESRHAENLVRDILRFPDWVKMPNGVQWNELPIVILIDTCYYEQLRSNMSNARSVTVCKVPYRHDGLRDFSSVPYGWEKIYDVIEQEVRNWTLELIEKRQSLGWALTTKNGVNNGHYKSPENYDTENLTPRSSILTLNVKTLDGKRFHRQLKFNDWDASTVAKVLESLDESVDWKKHVRESWFQRLFTENPYLLGAASFELVPHPQFKPDPDDKKFRRKQIPDFVFNRFSVMDPMLSVIELKRPDMSPRKFSRTAMQPLRDTDFINAHSSKMEQLFGEALPAGKPLLIASHSDHSDFAKMRSYEEKSLNILGFDELSREAVQRYTFTPSEDLVSVYSTNRGSYRPR